MDGVERAKKQTYFHNLIYLHQKYQILQFDWAKLGIKE
jgi:hypothetical protein